MKQLLIYLSFILGIFFFNQILINATTCIDINTASQKELEKLTGIGPTIAQNIINARPFNSLDDLIRVSGIAEKKLIAIKEQGLACIQSISQSPDQNLSADKNISSAEAKPKPEINLSYPTNNPVNKTINLTLTATNLANVLYDIKIAIQKEKIISEIYNEKENKWQSANYYLKEIANGPSFEKSFQLKINEKNLNFQGEAEIIIRLRESDKSSYLEHKQKININLPEIQALSIIPEKPLNPEQNLANISQISNNLNYKTILTALVIAFFSATIIFTLKNKLNRSLML